MSKWLLFPLVNLSCQRGDFGLELCFFVHAGMQYVEVEYA
jgi:hypothetical protein